MANEVTWPHAPELWLEPLSPKHRLDAFSCGEPALDNWLKQRALANQRNRFCVTMVAHREGRSVGFYALAPTAVIPASMSRSLRTGQPPDPIPCILLGQLAVDQSEKGRGLGADLLADALRRAVSAAELIGGRALIVRALHDDASRFWTKHGFRPSRDEPLLLMRSISDIAASILEADS